MRLVSLFYLLLVVAGISTAQDTNFTVGPQYLITTDSTLFLQPIATPSLSLSAPLPSLRDAAPETPVSYEASSASAELPSQTDFARIYWGKPQFGENVSVVEVSSAEPERALPVSMLDVGVTELTDAQSLRERGIGVTLGEAASFWRGHRPHAEHVYTNADVERLHGG